MKQFPRHPRYGARAGDDNSSFLDAALLQSAFLDLLTPYRPRVATLIFEFGSFARQCYPDVGAFLRELDPFLGALPRDFRYAVEIRNPEFLSPEYFACLRSHRVAHVFNAWTRMPEIGVQMHLRDAYTADFSVARALLRRGRAYEEAVAKFTPYASGARPEPRDPRCASSADRPGPPAPRAILYFCQQPPGGQCARNHRSHHRLMLQKLQSLKLSVPFRRGFGQG